MGQVGRCPGRVLHPEVAQGLEENPRRGARSPAVGSGPGVVVRLSSLEPDGLGQGPFDRGLERNGGHLARDGVDADDLAALVEENSATVRMPGDREVHAVSSPARLPVAVQAPEQLALLPSGEVSDQESGVVEMPVDKGEPSPVG